ncbi:MAG: radical SAM protein, partial [Deltaproteobacteria bacterium]
DGRYWICGFWIEKNYKWDPRNYDDRKLLRKIKEYTSSHPSGRLIRHLIDCALRNHCFAAKNLFFRRWEAPLPVSRTCNARCLGCLSFQPKGSFPASHERIRFTPSKEEIVEIAVSHLESAPDAIVSFGQGCEGEPLMEYKLIAESIKEIRKRTKKGVINLNTNGSDPEKIKIIAESGLDSIRISLNSVRPQLYRAYYRPKDYDYEDVIKSIRVSKEMGLYTMINYLIFPGISDQKEEISLLKELIKETEVDFIHLKNLCIDPVLYVKNMPAPKLPGIGIKKMADIIKSCFPDIELGYFNRYPSYST